MNDSFYDKLAEDEKKKRREKKVKEPKDYFKKMFKEEV